MIEPILEIQDKYSPLRVEAETPTARWADHPVTEKSPLSAALPQNVAPPGKSGPFGVGIHEVLSSFRIQYEAPIAVCLYCQTGIFIRWAHPLACPTAHSGSAGVLLDHWQVVL